MLVALQCSSKLPGDPSPLSRQRLPWNITASLQPGVRSGWSRHASQQLYQQVAMGCNVAALRALDRFHSQLPCNAFAQLCMAVSLGPTPAGAPPSPWLGCHLPGRLPTCMMEGHARLAAIAQEQRQLAKQIRQCRQNQQRKAHRLQNQGGSTLIHVLVLPVYLFSNKSLDLAVQCWMLKRRQKSCAEEDASRTRGIMVVSQWVENMTEDDEDAIRHSDLPTVVRVRDQTRKFLVDAHAAVWAMNNTKSTGHAPSSQQVWEARAAANRQWTGDAEGELSATSSKRTAAWALRWRRRWFFKYVKIRTRERMDLDAVQDKARGGVAKACRVD